MSDDETDSDTLAPVGKNEYELQGVYRYFF